jgi:hypothetical protein
VPVTTEDPCSVLGLRVWKDGGGVGRLGVEYVLCWD